MKQHEASKLLRGFKQAFSEQTVTAIGRATGFFKRERKMTPMKLMMSLLSCFAVVESGVCTIHARTRVARVIDAGGRGTEAVTRGLVGGIWTGLDPGR
jgi:hypothetical protein